MSVPLQYRSLQDAPKVVTLIDSDHQVRLIFPPPPKWTQVGFFVSHLFVGACIVAEAGWFLYRFRPLIGDPLLLLGMYAAVAASGFLWIVIGLIGIIVFQRVGRTPNVLAATNEELTWTHRRFWWMRTRAFAGDQVAAITVKKVHDIFRRNRAFRLRIHFKANRPFTLGINSPDASLADRAASALRKILKLAAESEN